LLRFVPAFVIGITILSLPLSVRAQSRARKIFKDNCVVCHGADGTGNTPKGKALGAADLKSDEVQKQSDEELATVIAKGRGSMPAFADKLSQEAVNSLIAYIRRLPKK
jgi:mono/diheme cytochrome c family protein